MGAALLFLTSCTTITVTKTSRTAEMPEQFLSATVADLEVAPGRASVTYTPSKQVLNGGVQNVYKVAERQLLDEKGCDVLVNPEYTVEKTRKLFRTKVTSVTVTGRPAKFKGFRSLNDSVWCNPVFRVGYKNDIKTTSSGLMNFFKK